MFKIETVVLSFLFIWLTFGNLAAAENPPLATYPQQPDCSNGRLTPDQCKTATEAWIKSINRTSSDECGEKDLTKAKSDFSEACKNAGINSSDCAGELNSCDDKTNEKYEGGKRKPNEPLDVGREKDKDEKCPAMAGADLDKYEKQLKDQDEKVKKLEKEIPELEEKANKVINNANEKMADMKTQAAKDQADHAKELKDSSRNKQAAEKAITDQITGIQVQISKANDALGQVSITKMEGQVKLKQTKTQADLNCHASASAQVAKMQTDVLESMKNGTYNGGDFLSQMKKVGVSDRQQWQRVAKKYYQWCLDSKPTVDTKDGANDGYKLLVAQSDKSESSIREQIRQLQAQQLTLRDNNACGQSAPQPNGSSSGETALCQAARNAYEDAMQSEADYRSKVQANQEKYTQLAQQSQRESNSLNQQAIKKKQEIADENKRLENLKAFLDAKYAAGASSNIDAKALSGAQAKLADLKSTGDLYIACRVTQQTSAGKSANCLADTKCASVKHWLQTTLHMKNDEFSPTDELPATDPVSKPIDPDAPRPTAPPTAPTGTTGGTGTGGH